jgi:hypothetical protein
MTEFPTRAGCPVNRLGPPCLMVDSTFHLEVEKVTALSLGPTAVFRNLWLTKADVPSTFRGFFETRSIIKF